MGETAYVYFIRCADQSLYCGFTTDLDRRWHEHLDRSPKCKYTRRKGMHPLQLVACWEVGAAEVSAKREAMRVEYWLKQRNKREKEDLVREPYRLKDCYSKDRDRLVNLEPVCPKTILVTEEQTS